MLVPKALTTIFHITSLYTGHFCVQDALLQDMSSVSLSASAFCTPYIQPTVTYYEPWIVLTTVYPVTTYLPYVTVTQVITTLVLFPTIVKVKSNMVQYRFRYIN